ncbi:type II toxin-antitoxin system RelE family toxin [Bdellovibrio sp. BCCA]|uniref:type II toxin-antitoxin system RelE family toxin n=1 Tax=Bdellovibrio sp. BCCA TaxID=3136281 RepID=UPI00403FDC72
MTRVLYSRLFEKQIEKVPAYIQSKVEAWTFSVTNFGIHETAKNPDLHDEPLKGNRIGQRSVRLTKAYRLSYRIIEDRVLIELLEVHKHDY